MCSFSCRPFRALLYGSGRCFFGGGGGDGDDGVQPLLCTAVCTQLHMMCKHDDVRTAVRGFSFFKVTV